MPIVLVARIIDDSSVDKCFQNDISDILIFPATHAILKMRLRNCILVAGMKKKLHDNDLQMEAAFEIAQIGTWEYLTTENVTHYSKQWNSIFGNMADRGNSTTVNAYPDGNFWNSDAFSRHISGQRESYVNEYRITSYNVCYTKLLRATFNIFRPSNSTVETCSFEIKRYSVVSFFMGNGF